MVLLKNEGVLPMSAKKQVNGGEKAMRTALFGITSYMFYAGGTGSGDVNKPYVVDLQQGLKNAGFVTDDTLTTVYTKYKEFGMEELEAEMGTLSPNKFFPRPRVREPLLGDKTYMFAAKSNDMAIVTVGRSSGEAGDRLLSDFNINADEQEMLQKTYEHFHKAGKPVVVILNVGGAVNTEAVKPYADAILLTWQPGMEAGNAIADVLTGKANPSGKLTMTWPIAATDHPSTRNFPQDLDMYTYREMQGWDSGIPNESFTNHEEDIYVGYRYFDTFDKQVAYPFGFGLSYTTFEFSQPKVKVGSDKVTVTVNVKNTGSVSGKEVAQVYVTAPKGTLEKPVHELKAFAKTRELQPGESQTLTMTIPQRDLASFDEAHSQWLAEAGTYTFRIGSSSRDIKVTATTKVSEYTEKVNNAMAPQQALNLLKQ
jgi:beta-glucosidase